MGQRAAEGHASPQLWRLSPRGWRPGETREMGNSTHSDIRLSFGHFMFQVAVLWAALSTPSPSHLDQECSNRGFIRPVPESSLAAVLGCVFLCLLCPFS